MQFARAADLSRETHTPRAHHAAIGEQRNLLTDVVLVDALHLGLVQATVRVAKLVGIILQVAFARLIADRTVQRMVQQEELKRLRLSLLDFLAVSQHHGVGLGGGLASWHQLGNHRDRAVGLLLTDFNQAHPAACHDA